MSHRPGRSSPVWVLSSACPLVLVERFWGSVHTILFDRPTPVSRHRRCDGQTGIRAATAHCHSPPPLSSSPCPVDLKRAKSPDQAAMTLVSVQMRTNISGKDVARLYFQSTFITAMTLVSVQKCVPPYQERRGKTLLSKHFHMNLLWTCKTGGRKRPQTATPAD